MNEAITYGGLWTHQKLEALRRYLDAYLKVFKNQRDWVKLYYIDAFAGPGSWNPNEKKRKESNPTHIDANESTQYKEGSPIIALSIREQGFNKFIFIDKKEEHIDNLKKRVEKEHPEKIGSVEFMKRDANVAVRELCNNWETNARAVVFLDPFGMEVKWQTIEAIAKTEAMDLWVLFPVGIAVNRMLKKDGDIPPQWKELLDGLFGTEDWRDHFYREEPTLFSWIGDEDKGFLTKTAPFEKIVRYFITRLKSVFPSEGVVKEPLMLRNSTNNPLFALCFAAGNKKGAPTAVRIAKHIIDMKR